MSGALSLMEKGWSIASGFGGGLSAMGLGNVAGVGGQHKESVLHEGEGPIWKVEWGRNGLIAWANDRVRPALPRSEERCHCRQLYLSSFSQGVKIYDSHAERLISFIDRPPGSPRADLFKPILTFVYPPASSPSDPTTLIIAWADHIKLARIRNRSASSRPSSIHYSHSSSPSSSTLGGSGGPAGSSSSSSTSLFVEIVAIFQIDCMISGLTPYKSDFLVLAYVPPDEESFDVEATESREEQRRKAANRPELRIISRRGEELSSDALSLTGYHLNGCNDYVLAEGLADAGASSSGGSTKAAADAGATFLVLSPKDIVVARERDGRDRVEWLVERGRYEEALDAVEKLTADGKAGDLDGRAIGEKFLQSLMAKGISFSSKKIGRAKTDGFLSSR